MTRLSLSLSMLMCLSHRLFRCFLTKAISQLVRIVEVPAVARWQLTADAADSRQETASGLRETVRLRNDSLEAFLVPPNGDRAVSGAAQDERAQLQRKHPHPRSEGTRNHIYGSMAAT